MQNKCAQNKIVSFSPSKVQRFFCFDKFCVMQGFLWAECESTVQPAADVITCFEMPKKNEKRWPNKHNKLKPHCLVAIVDHNH